MSLTQPGQAPAPVQANVGAVHVMRRSLEARNSERIAAAAVTPQAFVSGVERAMQGHEDPLCSNVFLSVGDRTTGGEQSSETRSHVSRHAGGAPRSSRPQGGPEITEV